MWDDLLSHPIFLFITGFCFNIFYIFIFLSKKNYNYLNMKGNKIILLAVFTALFACNYQGKEFKKESINIFQESLDSSGFSVYLGNALKERSKFTHYITADLESDVVDAPAGKDAADDPAIWVNMDNPEKSLVIGTNKKAGLHVYDMEGKETQYLKVGCMNNIDLRDDFNLDGKNVVLVAASNCTLNTISLFFIDKSTLLMSDTILNIKSSVDLSI